MPPFPLIHKLFLFSVDILQSFAKPEVLVIPKDVAEELQSAREVIARLRSMFLESPWANDQMRNRLAEIVVQLDKADERIHKLSDITRPLFMPLEALKKCTELDKIMDRLDFLRQTAEMASSRYRLDAMSRDQKYAELAQELGTDSPKTVRFVAEKNKKSVVADKINQVKTVHGAWSEVWECHLSSADEEVIEYKSVAFKSLQWLMIDEGHGEEIMDNRFEREERAWRDLKHRHIAPLLGVVPKPTYGFISPWYANGSLETFPKGKSFSVKVKLLHGTAEGLAYLHSMSKVHGDLRPPNVVVDGKEEAILIDFGGTVDVSIAAGDTITVSRVPNVTRWMAPERMGDDEEGRDRNLKPTEASDIYCFGLLCIKVITEAEPFVSLTDNRIYGAYTSVTDESSKTTEAVLPSPTSENDWAKQDAISLWELVHCCWEPNPGKRPPMNEIAEKLKSLSEQLGCR